jgi:hypothetical protein
MFTRGTTWDPAPLHRGFCPRGWNVVAMKASATLNSLVNLKDIFGGLLRKAHDWAAIFSTDKM